MIRSLFVFLLVFWTTVAKIKFQSIGVNGTLLCGSAPTPGIRVRLWDNDMGELVDSPKQNSFTDFDGYFSFDDWTPANDEIDPLIRIAHDCNDGVKPGQRLFKFKIPKSYVIEGKEVPKDMYFHLGTINLEMKPFNEERYYKGEIGKRGLIRPYAHKIHRTRRSEPVQPVQQEQPREGDAMTRSSSSEDACSSGLCTFSADRKRRENENSASDGKSDEIIKKEEPAEDSGCSDGACPIDLSRKRRTNENSASDGKSDEIVKKEEPAEDSGCSDGACPIDLSRKRRHEDPAVDCGDSECPLNVEKHKKNFTKSAARDKYDSPEDRIEPW